MSEPTRRVFFALWPREEVRTAIAHAVHKAARGSGGRPVPTDKLHATLLFLGSIPESRLPDLVAIGARVASAEEVAAPVGASPPHLIFDRIEFWTKSHVLVATTSDAARSAAMPAQALANTLAVLLAREAIAAGFAPDSKPFRAHITVARKVVRFSRALVMRPVTWDIDRFVLVESETRPEGSLYRVIETFSLVDSKPSAGM